MPDLTVREAVDFLIAEARKKGGAVYSATMSLGTRIRRGEAVVLVKLGANGKGESVLGPVPLAQDIGFGEYIIGFYIIGTKEKADVAGVLEVPAS